MLPKAKTGQDCKQPVCHSSSFFPFWSGCLWLPSPVILLCLKVAPNSCHHISRRRFWFVIIALFMSRCYNHGIKKMHNYWWTSSYRLRDTKLHSKILTTTASCENKAKRVSESKPKNCRINLFLFCSKQKITCRKQVRRALLKIPRWPFSLPFSTLAHEISTLS